VAQAANIRPWTSRWSSILAFIGLVTLARLAYLALWCPYALLEDEAHYWEWSRTLDWSYYSKGPGIAWTIAASTRLFGDTEFGVRAFAPIFAALAAIGIAGLARDATGEPRAGFYAAACFMLAPIYLIGAIMMTIDIPYLAAWSLACWAAWRGFSGPGTTPTPTPSPAPWAALGLALAVGFLFKYTILLLVPGLAVFAWLDRAHRPSPLRARHLLLGLAIASVGLLPVAIWNAGNGWPTVHHLLGHLRLASGDLPAKDLAQEPWRYDPMWTLEFIALQLVILGPVLYLGLVGLVRALRGPGGPARRGMRFLACCGAPIFLFYLLVTPFGQTEGNWASAAYITLLPAAGLAAARSLSLPGRSLERTLWRVSLAVGITVAVIALRLDWVADSAPVSWLDRRLQAAGLKNDRPLIPAQRLLAPPIFAADASRRADEVRAQTGLEPFFIAEHYGRASLLAFYLPGRPTVYCSSSLLDEGRRTQYDYWPRTDLHDLARLGGRPAVCLGKTRERWLRAFERVEDLGKLAGEPKKDRLAFIGYGYHGFGPSDARPEGEGK
jgi:4-amino-4-deoxy-L-arabinose transferase-like glycosyltransferase